MNVIPIFTPWRVEHNPRREDIAILDSHGHEIGSMNRTDLAEEVVRGVNEHAKLKAALQRLLDAPDPMEWGEAPQNIRERQEARNAALALI